MTPTTAFVVAAGFLAAGGYAAGRVLADNWQPPADRADVLKSLALITAAGALYTAAALVLGSATK